MRQTVITALLLLASIATAQQPPTPPVKPTLRELTIENIFDPKDRVAFSGSAQSGFVWLDDKTFTWPRTDEKNEVVEQMLYDTQTGTRRTLFNAAQAIEKKFGKATGDESRRAATPRSWTFTPDKKSVLYARGDDIYLYTLDTDTFTKLTSSAGEKKEPTFSPDGKLVAFISNNNLYVLDVASHQERQLTTDGGENTLNGILDWVYQEEVYGRGKFRAYWWSPDSSHLAFMQLDERPVKRFAVVDHIPTMQKVEEELYPKAGLPNPIAHLFTVALSGGAPREVDNSRYAGTDTLIVSVDWTPDSSKVIYQIQNREQTWLDLNTAVEAGGAPKTLFRETTKAWVEPTGDPEWLKDGSFLWLSERSGFKHIYQYNADGTLKRQVTNGPWEVRTLHGIDPSNQWIYFSGTERSVTGGDVYRIRLDGTQMKRLSDAAGVHRAIFNPSKTQYVDSWTDINTPAQTALHRNDGTRLRVVDANDVAVLRDYRLSKPEFLQVKTRDGFTMEAMMIKPADFDPSRKYPIYEYTYSGPHAQQVINGWKGSQYLWWQLLAQRGMIVWVCDNRTASGKGVESTWPVYKHFGELELRDLEDGLKWLTSQPYVDGSRVILDGWSFGGFMTSYTLTHSTMWSAGIAGGTVADWHDYDSIYTERYMLTPQNNPDGYQNSSPRFAAKNLHGDLLLLHGTIDDNVHMQNTIQFIYELEKAGKPFRLSVYPKSRHGVTDPALVAHMRMTMMRFIEDTVLKK